MKFIRLVSELIFSSILCFSYAYASDLGDLGKAVIKADTFYLPDGDLGKLGKAIIKGDTFYLPSGDLGKLGKAIIKKDTFYLPN